MWKQYLMSVGFLIRKNYMLFTRCLSRAILRSRALWRRLASQCIADMLVFYSYRRHINKSVFTVEWRTVEKTTVRIMWLYQAKILLVILMQPVLRGWKLDHLLQNMAVFLLNFHFVILCNHFYSVPKPNPNKIVLFARLLSRVFDCLWWN